MLQNIAPRASAAPAALHLVEEISHRVVNEFSEAIAMITLAARGESGTVRTALEQAADRLRVHARSHSALLPPRTEGLMDLAEHLEGVCGAMSGAFIADKGNRLMLSADAAMLPAATCWRIGLIVAELVRNAARHGLAGEPGLIFVRVAAEPGALSCVVRDTGTVSGTPKAGLGQKLVRNLAAELGGSVDWRFGPDGTTARVTFPTDGFAALAPVLATH